MSKTDIIKSKKLSWLNIINASEKEISYLKKKFKFNEFDLADSYSHKHAQRPKILFRPNYIFIVMLFPIYNRKTREINPAEIDIFITKDHIITLHYNKLQPLKEFFKNLQKSKKERNIYLNQNPAMFFYEMLDRLYESIFPMTDHISLNISAIEKNIFAGKERQMVNEILIIKRNIVIFRKIMQSHKNLIKKLIYQKMNFFEASDKNKVFFLDLIDHAKNIWEILENHQQTINALEDTNTVMVTFKLNDIMRTLTIFSVIVFPLTLMAAIFGMNVNNMPIVGTMYDFWKVIILMVVATVAMFGYFKYKKWI